MMDNFSRSLQDNLNIEDSNLYQVGGRRNKEFIAESWETIAGTVWESKPNSVSRKFLASILI